MRPRPRQMTLGRSKNMISTQPRIRPLRWSLLLKLFGLTWDKKLSCKPHVDVTLNEAYAKIAALHGIKHLVPSNVMITLYKAYVLPHFEYCSPLPLGISRTLNNKLERANYYDLGTILNLGRSVTYDMSFHRLTE